MRVHLIRKQTVENYALNNGGSRKPLTGWLAVVKFGNWEEPADIKQTFGSADLLGNGSNRVVFDIGGNNYRMICKYLFGEKQVHLFVCWIGTHAEYDKLCNSNMQYTINSY
jgi:mRNA interferase HigB